MKFRFENIGITSLILKSSIFNFINKLFPGHRKVHVIGDSHALSFTHPKIVVHYLGATTAHNLISDKAETKSNMKIMKIIKHLDKSDSIVFVFGEIDCRIHFYNQYMKMRKKVSLNDLINETVKRYIKYVVKIKDMGLNVFVFNAVPPGEQGNHYNYPFYADRNTRLKITKKFNQLLKNSCRVNNIEFIDVFNKLIKKNGKRIPKFKLDSIHYNTVLARLLLLS